MSDRNPVPGLRGDAGQRSPHVIIERRPRQGILPALEDRPLDGAIEPVADDGLRQRIDEGCDHSRLGMARPHLAAKVIRDD